MLRSPDWLIDAQHDGLIPIKVTLKAMSNLLWVAGVVEMLCIKHSFTARVLWSRLKTVNKPLVSRATRRKLRGPVI